MSLSGYSQSVREFSIPDLKDGQSFDLAKYFHSKAVVLIFHSNRCAFSNRYIERIKGLETEFSPAGIVFALINSNNGSMVIEESSSGIKAYIKQHNIRFSYLLDSAQEVKNMLKAQRTPEVVVLKPLGGHFIIHYRGTIDDNPQGLGDSNHQYLREALLSLLNNESPAIEQTRPVGCLIK